MFIGIVEKIAFVFVVLLLMALGAWWWLGFTIIVESLFFLVLLVAYSPGRRLEYAVKGISATPFRYALLAVELVVLSRFVFDLATGRRGWRK